VGTGSFPSGARHPHGPVRTPAHRKTGTRHCVAGGTAGGLVVTITRFAALRRTRTPCASVAAVGAVPARPRNAHTFCRHPNAASVGDTRIAHPAAVRVGGVGHARAQTAANAAGSGHAAGQRVPRARNSAQAGGGVAARSPRLPHVSDVTAALGDAASHWRAHFRRVQTHPSLGY